MRAHAGSSLVIDGWESGREGNGWREGYGRGGGGTVDRTCIVAAMEREKKCS